MPTTADPEVARAIGTRIKQRREALGMTQDQIGIASGSTGQTLSKIERGRGMTVDLLRRVTVVLQCSAHYLLFGADFCEDAKPSRGRTVLAAVAQMPPEPPAVGKAASTKPTRKPPR